MYRTKKQAMKKRLAAVALAATGLAVATTAVAGASGASTSSTHTTRATPPGPRGFGPPPGWANGNDGSVSAVDSSSITITKEDGTTATYSLSTATVVHTDRTTTGSLSDLAVGEHVHIVTSSSSSSSATEVDVIPAHVGGKVVSVTGTSIVVSDRDGFYRTINTTGSTTFTKSGASSSLSAVTVGEMIGAEGTVDANHTTLDASTVTIGAPTSGAPEGPGGPMGM
jgi:hypothetical protein